jgi:YD repeat-containing protein
MPLPPFSRQRSLVSGLVLALGVSTLQLSAVAPSAQATSGTDVSYSYDDAGRLRGVVDATEAAAGYLYDAAGNITSIQRFAAGTTAVLVVSPSVVSRGALFDIKGAGFDPVASANTVTVNGVAAVVEAATSRKLTVRMPAAASTGSVSVTSPQGTSTFGPITVFGNLSPTITGASPVVVAPGGLVNVTGNNFDPATANDVGALGSIRAVSTTAAQTSLSLTVPAAAAGGRLSIRTPGGSAQGPDVFVVPSPFAPSQVTSTGRITVDGASQQAVIGSSAAAALMLFDVAAGTPVAISVSQSTLGSCNLNLKLLDPTGSAVPSLSCVGASGGLNAGVLAGGTYGLVLYGTGSATGTVSVAAARTANQAPPTSVDGPAVLLGNVATGDVATSTFAGTAGQKVIMEFSGDGGYVCCSANAVV